MLSSFFNIWTQQQKYPQKGIWNFDDLTATLHLPKQVQEAHKFSR